MNTIPNESIRRVLSENPKKSIEASSLIPAAVMLILYQKNGELWVILNRRTNQVEHHKNEISFPGGSKEAKDKTLLDTALRETYEEMGIPPNDIEVLGRLGDIATITKFLMTTFVGTITYPYKFKPNDKEVAEVLEVPLSALMKGSNLRDDMRIINGKLANSPSYATQGHLIYGATAKALEWFLQMMSCIPDSEVVWKRNQPEG